MIPHIKFVWGGPEVIKGRWYLRLVGFYGRTEGAHDDGLAINARWLLVWLAGAMAAAWLLGAAALHKFWQRDPYSLLTYSDALFFPLRRSEIHDKGGQSLIARGTDALREKKWADAVTLLRQGLTRHSNDWRARLTLAQFYVATNQRALALRQLEEGLTDVFPGRAYLAGIFAIAEQGEDFNLVVKIARRYQPRLQGGAQRSDRRWVQAREFAALLGARRCDEALACAEAAEADHTAREQRVLALLELQRPTDALAVLAEWRTQPGAASAGVARLSVRAFREARLFEDMERSLEEMRAQAPADPRALAYGVVQQAVAGREAQAQAALENYLFRFGGSPENLQLVAEPLAEIGHLALLDRCAAAAAERGYVAGPFQILQVQTRARGGDWETAARAFAAMRPPVGPTASQEQIWHDWMRRLFDVGQTKGNAASVNLVDFLRSRPWPAKMLQTTAEAMRRAHKLEAAHDVLGLARAMFPASAWAEKQGLEVAAEIAAGLPAPAEPVATRRIVPAARVFFQQLDELLTGEQWAAAGQMIREVRNAQPGPAWLGARDGDLRLAELRIAQATGERARMLVAAALYLNGDAERSRHALDFARAFHANGDRESALALVNEVLRRSPKDGAARKQLAAWQPKLALAN